MAEVSEHKYQQKWEEKDTFQGWLTSDGKKKDKYLARGTKFPAIMEVIKRRSIRPTDAMKTFPNKRGLQPIVQSTEITAKNKLQPITNIKVLDMETRNISSETAHAREPEFEDFEAIVTDIRTCKQEVKNELSIKRVQLERLEKILKRLSKLNQAQLQLSLGTGFITTN